MSAYSWFFLNRISLRPSSIGSTSSRPTASIFSGTPYTGHVSPDRFLPFRVECLAQADHYVYAPGGFSSRRYIRFVFTTTLKFASLPTGSRHLHLGFQLEDRSLQLPSMTTVPTKKLHWEDFHLLDEQCYGLHRTVREVFPHTALLKVPQTTAKDSRRGSCRTGQADCTDTARSVSRSHIHVCRDVAR